MKIVFENPHFLAADKAPGWLSVPSRLGADDARPCIGRELEKTHGRVWPVHRLDLEVSGLILFARNAEAHRAASLWFEKRELHKYYEALTDGTVPAEWQPGQIFNWKSRIHRGKKRAFEAPHGKDALTRATWLRQTEVGLLWRLEPLTGRSHQLRFELTKQGFPILGDQLYGAQTKFDGEGIALRAVELDFSGLADARTLGLPEQLKIPGLVAGKF